MDAAGRRNEILARRAECARTFPESWRRMVDGWRQDGPDAAWLTSSAGYLLRTAGVRWAIDPVMLSQTVREAPRMPADSLADLDLVFLTHDHYDHIDEELIGRLARMPGISWLLPAHMTPVADRCAIPASRRIVPEPLEQVEVGPLRITLYDGLHYEYKGRWGEGAPRSGIDASGCLAEWEGTRLAIPGDTRTYDASALPCLGVVDVAILHVWLGRGAALDPDPPQLDAMSSFAADINPRRRIVLTHLEEFSREPDDYWTREHAEQVRLGIEHRLPGVEVLIPEFWSEVPL